MPSCLLTKGQVAFYDLEDAEKIEKFTWNARWDSESKTFYAESGSVGFMHRFIMGLKRGDKRQVDHINHNGLDNRKENLRVVTNKQNAQNRKDVKGYTWHKAYELYEAKIKVDGKTISLGSFKLESDARQAYLDARTKYGFLPMDINS